MDVIDAMMRLFSGYEKMHGRYNTSGATVNQKGKVEGKAWTAAGPVTREAWEEHLSAKGPGLGIIPLQEAETVAFAAIDVDVYPLDIAQLERQIGDLPLTICRSKSGGAHLYLFLKEPLPAKLVIDKLREVAASLGYGGAEIFPKQHQRVSDRDVGNWINVPYFDYSKTMRYGYAGGRSLEVEEFITLCEKRRVDLKQLDALSLIDSASDLQKLLVEGPPCLQRLAQLGGFGEGQRNDGMFNVAVYLRKRYPDDWRDRMNDYGKAMCSPPLSLNEINGLVKSADRKDYEYRCAQPPIKSYCNRRLCLTREFGVGSGSTRDIEILAMTKYEGDPVLWGIDIGNGRVLVDTNTLYSQTKFNQLCMDVVSRCPGSMPSARWFKYLDDKLKEADVVPSPEDASPEGQFWLLFEMFVHGRVQAKRLDEVLLHKPFRENGKVFFTSRALFKFLDDQRYKIPSEHKVWQWLKTHGAEKSFKNIKGKGANLWVVAEPETTQEEPVKQAVPEQEPF